MEIRSQFVRELPRDIYLQMYSLNYRRDGLMRDELVSARTTKNAWQYMNYRVIYFIENNLVLSWCLFMPGAAERYTCTLARFGSLAVPRTQRLEKVVDLYFWTRAKYRKQGLGTKIGIYATHLCTQLQLGVCKVHPHDYGSRKMMIGIADAGCTVRE